MENSILLQNVSLNGLAQLLDECLEKRFEKFRHELNHQNDKDDLMTRDQVLELLQINSSTLWHWQNKNKIIVYKFANKNYYKRSEILENLTTLKK